MHGGHRTIEGQDLISGVDSYIYSLRNGAAAGGSCGQGWPTRVEAVGGREGRCRATPSEISGRPRQARLSNSTEGAMRVRRALAAAAAATCTRPPTARHWHQPLLYKPCCATFPFPFPCAVPPSLSRGAATPASARRGVLCLAWPGLLRPTDRAPTKPCGAARNPAGGEQHGPTLSGAALTHSAPCRPSADISSTYPASRSRGNVGREVLLLPHRYSTVAAP